MTRLIKIRVPKNGPLEGFLEMDILERATLLSADTSDDEDRDFERAAQIVRDGWNRDKHVLHFAEEHARLVLDAVNSACNCLDDEIEHAQGDRELIAINKTLVAAALRMHATIIKHCKGETHEI